jgi:hypothetical protein
MYGRRSLRCLAVTAIVFALCRVSMPANPRVPPAGLELTAFTTPDCAYANSLASAGLLDDAKTQYETLLSGGSSLPCAISGLENVARQSQKADQFEASGDEAAADGDLTAAQQDYTTALGIDQGNQAALSGLQTVEKERPNGIRQARDYWNQVVSNTLVPLGQFFLWLLAIFAGFYILYLLTRVSRYRM